MIDRKENILPALERSLKKIEDSTIGQESEDDFGGLFSDIDLACSGPCGAGASRCRKLGRKPFSTAVYP